jgi:hypothetical protein
LGGAGWGVGGPPPPSISETSVDAWWDCISAGEEALEPATRLLLEEAEAAAGGDGAPLSAMNRFKAAGAGGVLQQVEHLLSQIPEGSTLRAQRAHTASGPPLGMTAAGRRGGAGDGGAQANGGEAAAGGGWVGEVYDDTPFYHSMLRTLLENGGGGGATPAPPKLKRSRRPADSRQSKGRRLSYAVQPPLQNFVFPQVPEHPVILSELFSSVFGKRPEPEEGQDGAAGGAGGATGAGGAARRAKGERGSRHGGAGEGHGAGAAEVEVEVGSLFMR